MTDGPERLTPATAPQHKDRPRPGSPGRRTGSFIAPREERPARVPYALFGGNFDNVKSLRQGVIIERLRLPPISEMKLPLRKTLTIQRSGLARASSRKKAPNAVNLQVRLKKPRTLPPIAAIRAPTNKTSEKPSAISPATNIGEWFRNSASTGSSPQRWRLIV